MNEPMQSLIVSSIYEQKTLLGYIVVLFKDDAFTTKVLTLDAVRNLCERGYLTFMNAKYNAKLRILEGTMGTLSSYPRVSKDFRLMSKGGIVIAATILDKDTKMPVGCIAFNAFGVRNNLTYKKMFELAKTNTEVNYEFKKTKEYGVIAFAKNDQKLPIVEMQVNNKPAIYRSSEGETAPEAIKTKIVTPVDGLPYISVYSFDDVKNSEYNHDAQDKLIRAKINLRKLSPYYWTILESLKKVPIAGFGTMGVTEDTLVFDYAFVAKMDVPTLTFLFIHEISHIVMMHPYRRGKRNPDLWNIACDLYINTIINYDFDVTYGSGVKVFNSQNKDMECYIKTPDFGGIFLETIGETLDLSRDTPEKIYAKLLKENPDGIQSSQGSSQQGQSSKNGQLGQPNGGSSSSEGSKQQEKQGIDNLREGSQSMQEEVNKSGNRQEMQNAQEGANDIEEGIQKVQQGKASGDNSKIQEGIDQIQQGIDKMNDAKNSSGNSGNKKANEASEQMQNGLDQLIDSMRGEKSQGGGSGSGDNGTEQDEEGEISDSDPTSGHESVDDISQGDKIGQLVPKEVSVTYNGKKLTGTLMTDIMSNESAENQGDNDKRMKDSMDALQRAKTKIKMEEEKTGEKLAKVGGAGELAQRYIDFGLSQGLDWRVLLKNACKRAPKKTYTLGDPNRDYMNMGITVAGRRKVGHSKSVTDIKICIDVSGSVSRRELEMYMAEVANIFNYYNATGELIYWSTEVGDAGDFNKLKDMLKIKPITTGGTDVKCVFDYLTGKTKVNDKLEETKVRDISMVIIITDGYFDKNYKEYADYFNKKTLWIIDGNPVMFTPLFGRVVGLKKI